LCKRQFHHFTSLDSHTSTKKHEEALEQKARWLHRSHLVLVASFGSVLIVLVILALLPFPSSSQPMIIVTPTPTIHLTPTP